MNMSVEERIKCCRIIEKMEQQIEYTKKLGLKNNSRFYEKSKSYDEVSTNSEVVKC